MVSCSLLMSQNLSGTAPRQTRWLRTAPAGPRNWGLVRWDLCSAMGLSSSSCCQEDVLPAEAMERFQCYKGPGPPQPATSQVITPNRSPNQLEGTGLTLSSPPRTGSEHTELQLSSSL